MGNCCEELMWKIVVKNYCEEVLWGGGGYLSFHKLFSFIYWYLLMRGSENLKNIIAVYAVVGI